MEKLEEKIIKQVIENLNASTKVKWDRGGLDRWTDWAKIMRKSIQDNANILESMIESEDEDEEKPTKCPECNEMSVLIANSGVKCWTGGCGYTECL